MEGLIKSLVLVEPAIMSAPTPMKFTDAGVRWTKSDFETAAAAQSFGLETKMFRNILYEREVATALASKQLGSTSVTTLDNKSSSSTTAIVRGRLPTGKVLSRDGSSYINDRSKKGSSARKLKETTHVWELSGGTTGRGGWVLKPQSSTSTDVVDGKVIASSSSKPPASKKRSACVGCECGGCNKFKKIKSAASEYLAAADILSREMDTL